MDSSCGTSFPSTCFFRCNAGYELANGFNHMVCSTEGKWTPVGNCVDINGCSRSPCNTERSVCQDALASQHASSGVGHRCVCKSGYFGEPGFDGEGCQKLQITSSGSGITFSVGQGQDIVFRFGANVPSVGRLAQALKSMTAPLGNITLTRHKLANIVYSQLPDNEDRIDQSMKAMTSLGDRLREQSGDLVDVTAATVKAKPSLESLESFATAATSASTRMSNLVSTTLQSTTSVLATISSDLSTEDSRGTSLLTSQSTQLSSMDNTLNQIFGGHTLMQSTINQLAPLVDDKITVAVRRIFRGERNLA